MTRLITNIAERVRKHGLRSSATYAIYRLKDAWTFWRFDIVSAMRETMPMIARDQIGLTDSNCYSYTPSESYQIFRTIMRRHVKPRQEDVFLDYGSGLGRVLLMAATFPFRRVIGVEYSAELSAKAELIVGRAKKRLKCQDIRFVTADAATYDVPAEVTVIYFFNPFEGAVLAETVRRIKQSIDQSPRKVRIVYVNAGHFEKLVRGSDWLVKKEELVFPAIWACPITIYESREPRLCGLPR